MFGGCLWLTVLFRVCVAIETQRGVHDDGVALHTVTSMRENRQREKDEYEDTSKYYVWVIDGGNGNYHDRMCVDATQAYYPCWRDDVDDTWVRGNSSACAADPNCTWGQKCPPHERIVTQCCHSDPTRAPHKKASVHGGGTSHCMRGGTAWITDYQYPRNTRGELMPECLDGRDIPKDAGMLLASHMEAEGVCNKYYTCHDDEPWPCPEDKRVPLTLCNTTCQDAGCGYQNMPLWTNLPCTAEEAGTPPPTTAAPPSTSTCEQWCIDYNTAWTTKCDWSHCSGCSECSME